MLLLATVTYRFIFLIESIHYYDNLCEKNTSISTQRDFFRIFFVAILAHHSSFLGEVVNGPFAELTENSVPP